MEKVSSFFDHLKERFSNPLFFSFLISWLVVNWRISIALIWFDPKQIEATSNKSIFEFIEKNIGSDKVFWIPLLCALGYTLGMPVMRNLIRIFYSWVDKWGDKLNLRILSNGYISINKYLKLRSDHEERTKLLQDVISKEGQYLEQYNGLKTELLQSQNSNNETIQKLQSLEKTINDYNDTKILAGRWQCSFEFPNGTKGTEEVFIEYSDYNIVTEFGEKNRKFLIRDFHYDNRSGAVFFIKEVIEKEKHSLDTRSNINRLKFETKDTLVGTENYVIKIEYRRK